MDSAVLVNALIEPSGRYLDMLDKAGIRISAAFLAHLPEYEHWRLCLAGPALPADNPSEAYATLLEVFRPHRASLAPLRTDNLTVVDARGELVRSQLAFTRTGPGIHRVYSFGNFANGNALPDSIIFRLEPADPPQAAGSAPA